MPSSQAHTWFQPKPVGGARATSTTWRRWTGPLALHPACAPSGDSLLTGEVHPEDAVDMTNRSQGTKEAGILVGVGGVVVPRVRLHRVANVSLAVVLSAVLLSCGGGGDGGSAPNGDSAEEAAVPTSEQRDCVEASGVAEIAESFEFFGSADATVAEGGGVRSFLAEAYPEALSDGGDPPVIEGADGIPASSSEGEAAAFVYESPDDAADAASVIGWAGNSRVRGNVLLIVDPSVRIDPRTQDAIIDCLGDQDALAEDTSDEDPGPTPEEVAQCLREAGQEVEDAGAETFAGDTVGAAEVLHVEFQPELADMPGTLPLNIYVPVVADVPGVTPGDVADLVESDLSDPTIAGPLYRAGNIVVSLADTGVPEPLWDAVESCV